MENDVRNGLTNNPVELRKLIARSDSTILDRLLARHPLARNLLGAETSRRASEGGGVVDPTARLAAMRDLLLSGLAPLRRELDNIVTVVLDKMRRVQRITLTGAVVAAISGLVMAVTSAVGVAANWDKVVAAAFASVGGLVVIFSDYFQMAPNGRRIASAEEYGKLSQMASELLIIEKRTMRHDLFPLSEQEIEQMIQQTESYAAHINGLSVRSPMRVQT